MKEERYSDEVKTLLEAAQQQAVMNYNQELSTVHLLASLCGQEGFFKFLLQSLKIDEKAFTQETKDLLRKIPQVKGQDALRMSMGLARVFGLAEKDAGENEINIANLVGALVEDGDSDVVALCKKYGIDKKKVKALYMQYVSGKGDEENQKTLDKYGQQGWELVAVVPLIASNLSSGNAYTNCLCYTFKRKKIVSK